MNRHQENEVDNERLLLLAPIALALGIVASDIANNIRSNAQRTLGSQTEFSQTGDDLSRNNVGYGLNDR